MNLIRKLNYGFVVIIMIIFLVSPAFCWEIGDECWANYKGAVRAGYISEIRSDQIVVKFYDFPDRQVGFPLNSRLLHATYEEAIRSVKK